MAFEETVKGDVKMNVAYMRCEGTLNGAQVEVGAQAGPFAVVTLLERRRGIWERGEKIVVEKRELCSTPRMEHPMRDSVSGKMNKRIDYGYRNSRDGIYLS